MVGWFYICVQEENILPLKSSMGLIFLECILLSVMTGCGDAIARMYTGKSGTLVREFKGHDGAINALQVL